MNYSLPDISETENFAIHLDSEYFEIKESMFSDSMFQQLPLKPVLPFKGIRWLNRPNRPHRVLVIWNRRFTLRFDNTHKHGTPGSIPGQ